MLVKAGAEVDQLRRRPPSLGDISLVPAVVDVPLPPPTVARAGEPCGPGNRMHNMVISVGSPGYCWRAGSAESSGRRVTVVSAHEEPAWGGGGGADPGTQSGVMVLLPPSWEGFVTKVRQKLQFAAAQRLQFSTSQGALVDELEALRDGDVLIVQVRAGAPNRHMPSVSPYEH